MSTKVDNAWDVTLGIDAPTGATAALVSATTTDEEMDVALVSASTADN